MTPIQTVEAFIDAWNRSDLEAIAQAFTEDVIYHNIPMEPVAGRDEVKTVIAGFLGGATGCDWETHNIAANGPMVLTERTDNFDLKDGKRAAIRVMGTFEITPEGKIAKWRDYFDSSEMAREFGISADGE